MAQLSGWDASYCYGTVVGKDYICISSEHQLFGTIHVFARPQDLTWDPNPCTSDGFREACPFEGSSYFLRDLALSAGLAGQGSGCGIARQKHQCGKRTGIGWYSRQFRSASGNFGAEGLSMQ